MVGICDTLRDNAALYRRWAGARDPQRDLAAEHQVIVEAALARDADGLANALGQHYERTLSALHRLLEGEVAAAE